MRRCHAVADDIQLLDVEPIVVGERIGKDHGIAELAVFGFVVGVFQTAIDGFGADVEIVHRQDTGIHRKAQAMPLDLKLMGKLCPDLADRIADGFCIERVGNDSEFRAVHAVDSARV